MKKARVDIHVRICTYSTPFISTQKTKITTRLTTPLDQNYPWKEEPNPEQEKPAEELDENNQKQLHNIVGNYLYYVRSIDPTMLIELNSLAVLQANTTTNTAKQTTQVLNYSASHPDKVT